VQHAPRVAHEPGVSGCGRGDGGCSDAAREQGPHEDDFKRQLQVRQAGGLAEVVTGTGGVSWEVERKGGRRER
jgi:hypothetical protein